MNWNLFASTFGLIFLAELGDKTQLMVLTQVCKYRRPWPVFAGAALALTGVTALGAWGGQLAARLVPPLIFRGLAAVAFAVMGLLMLREAGAAASAEEGCVLSSEEKTGRHWDWRAFGLTAALLASAEMGDKTQLAVFTLASQQAGVWPIFWGGALALILVSAIGAWTGQTLARLLPQRWVLRIAGVAFIGMALVLVLNLG